MYPPLRNAAEWNYDYATTYRGGPQGVGAWLAYAKSLGKKLAVSEWAVNNGPSYGGGDNPYFVEQMHKFFADNAADIAYECYYNGNNTNLGWDHLLDPLHNPKSLAAYKSSYALPDRIEDGSLVREISGATVFVIYGQGKFGLPDPSWIDLYGGWSTVRVVPDGTLAAFDIAVDGTLLKEYSYDPVYLMNAGQRRWIPSPERLVELGLNWSDVRIVPNGSLSVIPSGPEA